MIELRSDTFTLPSEAMLDAARRAALGNDGYREDPTVRELEQLAAERLGKESALLVPSGTMGNVSALLTHSVRPNARILVGNCSDIYIYEKQSFDLFSGVELVPLKTNQDGTISLAELESVFDRVSDREHWVSAVCIENPHNMRGGRVLTIEYLHAFAEAVHARGAAFHLDGARLFNAAVALGCGVEEITAVADSVQFCMSKGLAAPIGSILVGTQDFVERARSIRKALGGTMRQAGLIAAPGIEALLRMTERLAEDHKNARALAVGLSRIPGLQVDLETVQTNTVSFHVEDRRFTPGQFVETLWLNGAHLGRFEDGRLRAVTHYGISSDNVDEVLNAVVRVMNTGPIEAPSYRACADS